MPTSPGMKLLQPEEFIRDRLVRRVRRVFHDEAAGETPTVRSHNAHFPPDSVIWRVHGDVTSMMVGGIAALLLEMLHPLALAGVLRHSTFRQDMLGRLRRTARFIAVTTYGEKSAADDAMARVRAIHQRVSGTLSDGRTYSASDPHLIAWIHVAGALCFLAAYVRYVEPDMSVADADQYFAEAALTANGLGAIEVPHTLAEAHALLGSYRPELEVTKETHEVSALILSGNRDPARALLGTAAIDLLPQWACSMLRLNARAQFGHPARLVTGVMARSLRWAFAKPVAS